MSTLSTDTSGPAPAPPAQSRLPFTGLLRAELRRLRLRRFVLLLLLIYFSLLVVSLAFVFVQFRPAPDPASLAAQYEQQLASCRAQQEVKRDVPGGGGFASYDCREAWGSSPTEYAERVGLSYSYRAADMIPPGVIGVAVAFAAVSFLLGATAIGADWSAKTLPGLLTWEPRRIRFLLVKLLALLLFVVPLAVLAQALHLGVAALTADLRGTWQGLPATFWPDLWRTIGRGVALAAIFATAGYALTAALRYTAATIGLAFGYLVVVEVMFTSNFAPNRWSQWVLSVNVDGWLAQGGTDLVYYETRTPFEIAADPALAAQEPVREIVVELTNGRSLTFLLAVLGALLLVALLSFRWRDIS